MISNYGSHNIGITCVKLNRGARAEVFSLYRSHDLSKSELLANINMLLNE